MRKLQKRLGFAEATLVAGLLYVMLGYFGKSDRFLMTLSSCFAAVYMTLHYFCNHPESEAPRHTHYTPTPPPALGSYPPLPVMPSEEVELVPEQPVTPSPSNAPVDPAADTLRAEDTVLVEAVKELRKRLDEIEAKQMAQNPAVATSP